MTASAFGFCQPERENMKGMKNTQTSSAIEKLLYIITEDYLSHQRSFFADDESISNPPPKPDPHPPFQQGPRLK